MTMRKLLFLVFAILLPVACAHAESPAQAAAHFLLPPPHTWEIYQDDEVRNRTRILKALDQSGCRFRITDRSDGTEYFLKLDTVWVDTIEYFGWDDARPMGPPAMRGAHLEGRDDILTVKASEDRYRRQNTLSVPDTLGWSSRDMYDLMGDEELQNRIGNFFSQHCKPTRP